MLEQGAVLHVGLAHGEHPLRQDGGLGVLEVGLGNGQRLELWVNFELEDLLLDALVDARPDLLQELVHMLGELLHDLRGQVVHNPNRDVILKKVTIQNAGLAMHGTAHSERTQSGQGQGPARLHRNSVVVGRSVGLGSLSLSPRERSGAVDRLCILTPSPALRLLGTLAFTSLSDFTDEFGALLSMMMIPTFPSKNG